MSEIQLQGGGLIQACIADGSNTSHSKEYMQWNDIHRYRFDRCGVIASTHMTGLCWMSECRPRGRGDFESECFGEVHMTKTQISTSDTWSARITHSISPPSLISACPFTRLHGVCIGLYLCHRLNHVSIIKYLQLQDQLHLCTRRSMHSLSTPFVVLLVQQ